MILQWTTGQIHDTVAAIARQPAYGAARESLVVKFFRWLFHWLGEIFRWAAGTLDARIILIAAAIVIALIVIGRVYVERRLATAGRRRFELRGPRGERRDYLALARELAGAGRYTDACHALHAVVLEAITAAGAVKYHASKTNGDYARELRRRGAPIESDFRSFGWDFDRMVYGHAGATADDYQRLLDAAERIVRAVQHTRAA